MIISHDNLYWFFNLFVVENKFFVFWPLPQMFACIDSIADTIGCPNDQVRTLFFLISNIFVGYFFRTIESPKKRYLFAMIYGIFIRFFTCLEGSILIDIQTFICFVLTKYFKKNAPKIILIESFLVLSLCHLQRQIVDYKSWRMDVATILMIATCKYVSFAFCYSDGFKEKKDLFLDQNEKKITEMPSYMEYCSYIYFFGSTIYGPTYEFMEYKNFIEKKDKFTSMPKGYLACFKQFILFAIFASLLLTLDKIYPLQFLTTSEFVNQPFWKKIYTTMVIGYLAKSKFYAGWSIEQSQLIATGLAWGGYNDKKEENWQGILAVDGSAEFLINPRIKMEKWNYSVSLWVKNFIYLRIANPEELKKDKNKAMQAQLGATFIISIWHGFYPGYYMAFPLVAFYTTLGKQFYKLNLNYKPRILQYQVVKFVGLFLSNLSQNVIGGLAELLDLESILTFFYGIYYTVPLGLILGVLFFSVTGYGQRPRKVHVKQN